MTLETSVPLTTSALGTIAANGTIHVPEYDRSQLIPAIAHIGVGAFHRAHQAVYLDELAEHTNEWGECGIGLLDYDRHVAEALRPQDYLYTVVERSSGADRARIVGSMVNYLLAPEEPERVLHVLADRATRVVSLTITEDGYNLDESNEHFNESSPAVVHDLEHPSAPVSVFGYLCEALDRRRVGGLPPCTILSCDNLQGNGDVAKTAIVSFARLRSDELGSWIEDNVAFPNSMVDRITPQTTDSHRQLVARDFGVKDQWPVITEPYRQWVVEDTFSLGRPPLEELSDGNIQFVEDVRPYETLKLRLLNGSHSAMAYLGYVAGYRQTQDVMADASFHSFIQRLMNDEVTALLPPVPGIDVEAYKRSLLERFANPKIGDQVSRLCLNGSAKLPKFLVPSVAQALAAGRPHGLLTLAIAGWMRYVRGTGEDGSVITIEDPQAAELTRLARASEQDPRPLLALRSIFGDLDQHPRFVGELEEALIAVNDLGARGAITRYLSMSAPQPSI